MDRKGKGTVNRLNITLVFLALVLVFSFNASSYAATDFRTGIDDMVRQIASSMQTEQKKRVAVMDFQNLDHSVSNLGIYISETLITKLFQTHKFKVIERNQLGQALKEIGLGQTGVVDQKSAQKVGKVLGVDSLVIGTVTDLEDSVAINSRLISTETGEVFAVAASEIQKNKVVASLLGQKISEPAKEVKPTEEKIPAGFNYLVVTKSGQEIPINGLELSFRHEKFYFHQRRGGGSIAIKFSDIKIIKLFEKDRSNPRLIVAELYAKSGKKLRGFIVDNEAFGDSEFGRWHEKQIYKLKTIYIR